MRLQTGNKLLMIGDSITDCERARPVGEGLFGGIGKGYVMQVDALLGSVYPERNLRVVNMGTGGNRVRDLKARWQTDVLDLHPDWVSIMIGTNDVWRQFDSPLRVEEHVYLQEYEETLDHLVAKTLPEVEGIILMTPFYIEPNRHDAMRAKMDEYGEVVKATAERHGTLFKDTQLAFDKALQHYYPATLGWDRVHPSHVGHMIVARAFLETIEFRWSGDNL
ncbi:MAG: SGNH/GDSL hydrolase family protein [Chthonomonadaceae bacterium]|nr:SGNH/GDSL hydrolase family protein [Chthonomonadaceae bacterium]